MPLGQWGVFRSYREPVPFLSLSCSVSDWHLKASRLMSHYNVAGIPKPRPAHSMPSVSMFSRMRTEAVRPYASATEVSKRGGWWREVGAARSGQKP